MLNVFSYTSWPSICLLWGNVNLGLLCDSGADPESGSGLWHLTRGPGNSGRDKYRFQIKLVINLENSIEFITEPAVGAFKMIEGMNA